MKTSKRHILSFLYTVSIFPIIWKKKEITTFYDLDHTYTYFSISLFWKTNCFLFYRILSLGADPTKPSNIQLLW